MKTKTIRLRILRRHINKAIENFKDNPGTGNYPCKCIIAEAAIERFKISENDIYVGAFTINLRSLDKAFYLDSQGELLTHTLLLELPQS